MALRPRLPAEQATGLGQIVGGFVLVACDKNGFEAPVPNFDFLQGGEVRRRQVLLISHENWARPVRAFTVREPLRPVATLLEEALAVDAGR